MQVATLASGLVSYIVGAAVAAFALDYCVQSFGTGLNASDRVGNQSEMVRPLIIVDRSHKGDRLAGGQKNQWSVCLRRRDDRRHGAAAREGAAHYRTSITEPAARASGRLRICVQSDVCGGAEKACRPLLNII